MSIGAIEMHTTESPGWVPVSQPGPAASGRERPDPAPAGVQATPFFWWPAADRRHAFRGDYHAQPAEGEPGLTICDNRVAMGPGTKLAWLWPTCWACWDAAKVIQRAERSIMGGKR